MNDRYECANCARVYFAWELNTVRDATQRVDPGEEMPDGECPACGALCYITVSRADKRITELEVRIVVLETALEAALNLINKGER